MTLESPQISKKPSNPVVGLALLLSFPAIVIGIGQLQVILEKPSEFGVSPAIVRTGFMNRDLGYDTNYDGKIDHAVNYMPIGFGEGGLFELKPGTPEFTALQTRYDLARK